MQKSAFTTVFLIAILFTGAITTALPSMIDIEAASDKTDREQYQHKDYQRDNNKEDKRDYSDKKESRDYDKKDKRDYSDKKESREYDDSKRDYKSKDKNDYDKEGSNTLVITNAQESYTNQYPKALETAKYDDYKEYLKEESKPYPQEQEQPYAQEKPKPYAADKPEPYAQEKPYPKAYPESDTKAYAESYDVKTPKKIKIIDCNNLNVNADELEDLEQVSPSIQRAIASNGDKELEGGSYKEYSENSPNTGVYYIHPDTKVIFKCNNENHNLINQTAPVADTDTTTGTENAGIDASTSLDVLRAVAENNAGLINPAESIVTPQSGNPISMPSTTMPSNVIPTGPSILSVPSSLG